MNPSGWLAQEQPSLGVETSPRLSLLLFAPAFVSGTSPASKAMLQANQVCQKRTEEAEFILGNPLLNQLLKYEIYIIQNAITIYFGRNTSG